MTPDLFDDLPPDPGAAATPMAPGAVLLHALARDLDVALLQAIDRITAQAPLRHMQTPGGQKVLARRRAKGRKRLSA